MVDEDQRSALMRQALDELEAQYDAVGAFSVTVDACVEIKCRGAISSHGSITTSTPSTRRLLDGVAVLVPHRSTEPALPRCTRLTG